MLASGKYIYADGSHEAKRQQEENERRSREQEAIWAKKNAEEAAERSKRNTTTVFLSVTAIFFAILPILISFSAYEVNWFGTIIAIVPFIVLFFSSARWDKKIIGTIFLVLGLLGNLIALFVGLNSNNGLLLFKCISNIISYIFVIIIRRRDKKWFFVFSRTNY